MALKNVVYPRFPSVFGPRTVMQRSTPKGLVSSTDAASPSQSPSYPHSVSVSNERSLGKKWAYRRRMTCAGEL